MNSKELSQLTGISDRTIRDWQAKEIVPKPDRDNLPLSEYIKAIVSHLKQQAEEAKNKEADEGELYQEKVRLTRAQADKVELEIAEKEGDLVNAREIILAWSKYILACRSRMLGMPAKLAYELAGVSVPTLVEEILREAIDEALEELGDVERMGITEENGDGIPSTTEADGFPVE